jgi:hypothetical protein
MPSWSFARVASDGHLFGIAAEGFGEAAANGLDTRIEDVPHVIGGVEILHFKVTDFRIHHDLGSRGSAAVIEVDHVAINGKGVPDVEPEIFIPGDAFGGTIGDFCGSGLGVQQGYVCECRKFRQRGWRRLWGSLREKYAFQDQHRNLPNPFLCHHETAGTSPRLVQSCD